MILGCPRPKYFFSGLPNLLPQKIRLPLIFFFSGVSYIRQTDTMFALIYKIYENIIYISLKKIVHINIFHKIEIISKLYHINVISWHFYGHNFLNNTYY